MHKKNYGNIPVKTATYGYTIVEVLTTVVIASVILISMYGGYLAIVRMWHRYNHQRTVNASVWLLYNKVNVLFRDNMHVIPVETDKWLFINNENDSSVIEIRNEKLFINSNELKLETPVEDFKIVEIERPVKHTVWETGYNCIYRKASSALKWQSVCMGGSIPESLPKSFKTMPAKSDLYWETEGK